MRDMMPLHVWHDAFTCVTWRIHMCDMTHSYVWHDAFTCVTWRIHMCKKMHSYVWHDTYMCVTLPIYECDMTRAYVMSRNPWVIQMSRTPYESFMRVTWCKCMWCHKLEKTHPGVTNSMSHLWVWHDASVYDVTKCMSHLDVTNSIWVIGECDIWRKPIWCHELEKLIQMSRTPWVIYECDMTQVYMMSRNAWVI